MEVRKSETRNGSSAGFFALVMLVAIHLLVPASSGAYELEAGIAYGTSSPANPSLNQLDLYSPPDPTGGLSPLVIWVHGGGWAFGDKQSPATLDKARLFTEAGYLFASVNYRLSPTGGDFQNPDPNRIRFPVHPQDVAKAIGWLARNGPSRGIDPDRMVLIGHSAGAHLVSLVSTDPSFLDVHNVDQRQIRGTIALDTKAFDITANVSGTDVSEPRPLFINAFGTAEENEVDGSWVAASPLTWADSKDPDHLFITQMVASRFAVNTEMAARLGQGAETVVQVPLNHNGINEAVGAPGDSSGTTDAVTGFITERLAAFRPPGVAIKRRPREVVQVGWVKTGGRPVPGRTKVEFGFSGKGLAASFECRLNGSPFRPCSSPRRYTVGRGTHSFRVRANFPSGRPAAAKVFKFRVKTTKRR
jgi:arylformamidase